MKILIACEESQTVCAAMRQLGHEAYSADIQKPSGDHPPCTYLTSAGACRLVSKGKLNWKCLENGLAAKVALQDLSVHRRAAR